MTVKDILQSATLFLGLYDEFKAFFNGTGTLSDEGEADYQKLLLALNLTLSNLALNTNMYLTRETKSLDSDSKFLISALTKTFANLRFVKDKQTGKVLKTRIVDNSVFVDGAYEKGVREVNVEYSYLPTKLTALNDNISLVKLGEKTLVLGVVSEYCFICGLFDDATIWKERFDKTLKENFVSLENKKMPKRKWF